MKFLISLITLLVLTNSCDSSKKAIEKSPKMTETLSGTYYITQLGNADVSSNKLVMTFDETTNKVSGFAGCNTFFGSYKIENNTLNFSDIAASKKLCLQDVFSVETQFFKSLKSVNAFAIVDNAISFSENDTILFNGSKKSAPLNKSDVVNYTDNTAVKYQASSQQDFNFILISKSRILISKDKGLQDMNTYQIKPEDWNALYKLIESIDVETIHQLTPPSTKHQFDGAPHTTLAIIKGDVEYMTPTFDEGNPPQQIEALVNKVLSITKNMTKQ
ncbi:MAG: META domain-containing protein [Winogradskyella sp.]|uniref:META domain-containing protein n=1 Tax=Winogradskyella sp. TaxID=1883156 RepID=UPI00385D8159